MAKNISAQLKTHLALETTTVTTCLLMKLDWRKIPISAITKANPAVITTQYEHALTTGQFIAFDNILGMTELNEDPHTTPWKFYTVTVLTATTFEIDTDSTAFTTYVSGGKIREVVSFTDYSDDLVLDNITYSASQGFTRSAVKSDTTLSVDTIDLTGIIGTVGGGMEITAGDVVAGRFDMAELRVFQLNYEDLSMGRMWLKRGWIGQVVVEDLIYTAEVRGMTQLLQMQALELYSPGCRYDLGDARCEIDLNGTVTGLGNVTVTGTVTGVTDNQTFQDTVRSETEDDTFKYGLLTWTSGNNTGLSMEVKNYTFISSELLLVNKMPFNIVIGDGYAVYHGCDKSYEGHCIGKFLNGVNFGGFPHLPGEDVLIRVIRGKTVEVSAE